MEAEAIALIDVISEAGIIAFLWFAYYRASIALQESRKHAERRERRLIRLLWHLCAEKDSTSVLEEDEDVFQAT